MTQNLPAKAPLKTGGGVAAIIPNDIEQAFRLAQAIANSKMAPKSYDNNPDKIMIGIMHGMELGMTPMAALQSIAVINNAPAVWGDGMLGLVRASGLLESFSETIEGEGDNMVARCSLKRQGETPTEREFSMADAKKANLSSKPGPWQQYPKRMLAMRARSWALRDTFADVLRGLRMAEEVMDAGPLVEQENGTYAPPPPTREAIEHHTEGYPFVNHGGELSELASGQVWLDALKESLDACIAEQGDVQTFWEANEETLDLVRAENPSLTTDDIFTTYHGWSEGEAATRNAEAKADFDRIIADMQAAQTAADLADVWKREAAKVKQLRAHDDRLFAMIEAEKESLKTRLTGKEAA